MLQADVVLDAALALEAEPDATAVHVDVPGTQGGQAVGAVVAGVAVVADADQGASSSATARATTLSRPRPGRRNWASMCRRSRGSAWPAQQALVLVGIAYLAPARVVAVLLAPTGVAAGGLEMAVGVGTDPDLAIGRRNGQLVQPADFLGVADALAVGVEIDEALALPASTDARLAVVDVAEAGGRRGSPVALRSCLGSEGKLACLAAAPVGTFNRAALLLLVADGAGDVASGDVAEVSAGPRLMPPEG